MDAVARDKTRFRAVNAPRQCGKGYLGCAVAFEKGWAGGRVWWISNVYSNSENTFRTAKRLLADVPVVRVRESDREIRFPSGGSITFKTAENPANLRGPTLDFLIGDEWAFSDPMGEVWNVIAPTLAVKKAGGLFLSTPNGLGDPWHQMVQRGDSTHPSYDREWKSWCFTSKDSLFITPAELELQRRAMGDLRFRQEFDGEFLSGAGARIKREWLRIEAPPTVAFTVQGVDLAVSERSTADHSAIVTLGRASDGVVWVLDAERIRAPFHGVVEFVKRKAEAWNPRSIAVEDVAYQRGIITELQRATTLPIRGVRPDGDKTSRFAPLESRVETGMIRFANTLPAWFFDELCSFPAGQYDDGVDAFTYGFGAIGTSEPVAKPRMGTGRSHTSLADCFPTGSIMDGYTKGGVGWG
jgi:predicted phage terminase large subunit-like protein